MSKDGWVAISHFLNCNNVKKLGVSASEIASAVEGSDKLDVNADKKSIRRTGNPTLPEFGRKRDVKAQDKQPA